LPGWNKVTADNKVVISKKNKDNTTSYAPTTTICTSHSTSLSVSDSEQKLSLPLREASQFAPRVTPPSNAAASFGNRALWINNMKGTTYMTMLCAIWRKRELKVILLCVQPCHEKEL